MSTRTLVTLSPTISAVICKKQQQKKVKPNFAPEWNAEIKVLSSQNFGIYHDDAFTAVISSLKYSDYSDLVKCIWDVKRVARATVISLYSNRVKSIEDEERKHELAETKKAIALVQASKAAEASKKAAAAAKKADDATWTPPRRVR